MTRRRIIFRPTPDCGFWITPEIICETYDAKLFSSFEQYERQWSEIMALFTGVQNHQDFFRTCIAVKACFPFCIAGEVQDARFHLSLDEIYCDELYEVDHGKVKRVHGTNLIYVQVYYREQEAPIVDTVEFDCPHGIAQEEVMQAIQAARKEMPMNEDEDRLSYMDDVLSRAAVALHASWAYINITGTINVE